MGTWLPLVNENSTIWCDSEQLTTSHSARSFKGFRAEQSRVNSNAVVDRGKWEEKRESLERRRSGVTSVVDITYERMKNDYRSKKIMVPAYRDQPVNRTRAIRPIAHENSFLWTIQRQIVNVCTTPNLYSSEKLDMPAGGYFSKGR